MAGSSGAERGDSAGAARSTGSVGARWATGAAVLSRHPTDIDRSAQAELLAHVVMADEPVLAVMIAIAVAFTDLAGSAQVAELEVAEGNRAALDVPCDAHVHRRAPAVEGTDVSQARQLVETILAPVTVPFAVGAGAAEETEVVISRGDWTLGDACFDLRLHRPDRSASDERGADRDDEHCERRPDFCLQRFSSLERLQGSPPAA